MLPYIIIGLDGGGTKTAVRAADPEGKIIFERRGGGMNYNTIPMDVAVKNAAECILPLPEAERYIVSIAHPSADDGFVSPLVEEFSRRLSKLLPEPNEIIIKSDVYMALYALSRGKSGIMIIGGTGSIGVAMDSNGGVHTVGGWGYPTNDEGSAYSIAVEGIKLVFDAFDGTGKPTPLTEKALKLFEAEDTRSLIDIFNAKDVSRAFVARFAVCVSKLADSGNEDCAEILINAAHSLSRYAAALAKKVPGAKIVGMTGGVLKNSDIVRNMFIKDVSTMFPEMEIRLLTTPPEQGAIYYAIDTMKGEIG
ncbi:MAG: hypothetical protein GX633_05805 [Clostridiales bacterium]|nr:hypothetical protein [Clostridiales bacterium]